MSKQFTCIHALKGKSMILYFSWFFPVGFCNSNVIAKTTLHWPYSILDVKLSLSGLIYIKPSLSKRGWTCLECQCMEL